MASSALSVASPCPVGEVLRAPTDGELYREEDYDGAASVSFVRCTTLPWFSNSAGDILRLLQHARFIIDSGRAGSFATSCKKVLQLIQNLTLRQVQLGILAAQLLQQRDRSRRTPTAPEIGADMVILGRKARGFLLR